MNEIKVISLEWIDIILLDKLYIYRNTNNDKGTFKMINNKLIIDWEVWGKETFIKHDNNEYYKEHYDKFTISIQTDTYYDEAELLINKRQIFLKNMKITGTYKFIGVNLSIKWENTNKIEIFYMYNYGKLFYNRKNSKDSYNKKLIKNVAIVFPQYHEIPENNKFWGKGFTEWTLLKKLPEKVDNQYIRKPHDDLGYYNLKDLAHRKFIGNLAKTHEIHSFCYYHYWFKNKKIMYEPTELMLKDGNPNLPFMFCWANEQWTKRWDGSKDNTEVLIEQDYDDEEGNIEHFKYLLQFFKNKNYIKIKNKPVFIFYRMEEKDKNSLENIIEKWNIYAKENGFSGIYFMRFLGPFDNKLEIKGIDGYVNFEPGYTTQLYGESILSYNKDNLIFKNEDDYNEEEYLNKNKDVKRSIEEHKIESGLVHYKSLSEKEKLIRTTKFNVHDGKVALEKIQLQKIKKKNQNLGIFVNWNNSARYNYENKKYSSYPLYYKNINHKIFGETYKKLLNNIEESSENNVNFLFISSWNEWNEQNSLEPNQLDGYNYLNEIKCNYYNYYNFSKLKNILIFSHRGGGTEKYINDLKKLFVNYNFIFYDEKINLNKYKNIDLIHINSFFMMNLIKNYVKFFKNNFNNIKKIITIHDYQWLYPDDPNILSYNLYKKEFNKKNAENFLELIDLCDNIIFPSYNILKNYNNLIDLKSINNKIIVNHHCDKFVNHNKFLIPKIDKYINVAFVGNYIEYKGSKVFKYLFNNVKYHETYIIKYHIFGYLSDEEKNNKIIDENFIYHGNYDEDNLNKILIDNKIHLLTHLSLFEESYCYALTNSINSGLPILYINHGAFTERLIKNNRYFPTSVNDLIKTFQETLKYIFKNQNQNNNINNNNNLQINKWYINNY